MLYSKSTKESEQTPNVLGYMEKDQLNRQYSFKTVVAYPLHSVVRKQ